MIGFFRFLMVLLLLVVVGMTSAIVTMNFAIHGAEVSIPDLHGMTIADAGQRTASLGLRVHVENHLYSTDVPVGRVTNQSPLPGTIVRRGWRVWLSESLGPQKLAIPNLLGQDQRVASIEVRRAEMQIGVVATMPWASAQPGTVIAQSPEPNASGVASPAMDLLVAVPDTNAPPPDALVMPDLQGQLFTAAALSLTRMGLHLAPLQQRPAPMAPVSPPGSPQSSTPGPATPTPPAGTIVAQSPPAGSRVDPSIPIQLTVAQ